ncbi:hypothetical protein IFM89_032478 [Coptis chinensis]|uniref:SWIM-type domain-containing protein n=1 Tax=Coptis chinensis TaxID=261450 RepID=A0A835IS40_9MAGN|nr:hypothetical protein IFM89_032478 [Coptis chinensis]
MCFSRDVKENLIETDRDLRSLACYCYGMKIVTVEIKVNVCMSSMSSYSGASMSSSSGSSSYLIGGERFALGAPEFRCKLIEYSIVSGYKYKLIKNDDFRVTAYGEMCSSLVECYNSWIDKERHLPITAMLDAIRIKMMKMTSAWRMECKNWKSFLCPKIEVKLLERTERTRSVTVTKSDDHVFKVDTEKHKHRVDLLRRDCTCNKWGIDGFPCRHAIMSIHCK